LGLPLAGDARALRLVSFERSKHSAPPAWTGSWTRSRLPSIRQLQAYFRGELKEFDLPLAMEGTEFQASRVGMLCALFLMEKRFHTPEAC